MNDSPTVTQQYAFAVGEDGDASIEPSEESVETSLETFGANVDHRERDTRIAQPEASSFGVDDRKAVTRGDGGEQRALFADTDDDQRTLTGERAASQCLFETDSEPEADTESDDHADEPTASTTASDDTPRALADGGRVEDGQPETNETVMVALPRKDLAGVADALDAERETIRRNTGEGPRTERLRRLIEECRNSLSLASDDEPATISRVAAADAATMLRAAAETEAGEYAEELRDMADSLRETLDGCESDDDHDSEVVTDGGQDATFDADAETVTDAWEGAYISASWGYNQTNVELAQIVAVSDTGKTVLARFVAAERVGHGRTSEQLRPTAEQYGDEFRLHVRDGIKGDPRFRGSYPLGSDGDMDGPTRRGSFYSFDNDPEHSIRQTAPNHGH
jgi:hypothetical protein